MNDEPTILVVDDNEDLLETFAMILKRRGFSVETAGNGASAVDKFKNQSFDVTLMDIVMPEMNGVDAFRKIKEMRPEASIILMTAYSDNDLIQIAKDEGVHKIIHKPIRIDHLIELINEAASSQPILIIDDDADICETLTQVLKQQGHEVLTAG
ncbi:MAG: response regulator, partial [Dehalococcoidales bacterium]|nr:response regulator [Dehalococcoidales bacterium]